jgi:dihydroflavonol-4-reductase
MLDDAQLPGEYKMKAFVTGSTGLLGNNLIHLLSQNNHVKALVRSKEKAESVFSDCSNITFIEGDMLEIDQFAHELEGCDTLFHTAAYFREYYQPGNHWQNLETINIKGTVTLLERAEKYGIKKVIYVSSAGVIGMGPNGLPGDESTPPSKFAYKNLYFKSKLLAEEAVQLFLQQHSLPVVLILPGGIFGIRDFTPTSSGQLVLNFLRQKLPGIIDGGGCFVDVRDVAQAMLNAVKSGRSGERYLVAGHYSSIENVLQILEQLTGIPAPKRRISYTVGLALAQLSEMQGQLTGKPVLLSRARVQSLHQKFHWSSKKALRELAIAFRPLEETLRDEVDWYQQHQTHNHLICL